MKYALVTGAGRGLGSGFVEYLLKDGYFVFAGVRELKPNDISKENLEYIKLDVSDDDSIDSAVKLIQAKTNTIHLIVNNAGINKDSVSDNHSELVCKVKDVKRNLLLEMFNVNTISPLIVVQRFLPLLKSEPAFVINISSCRASYHDEFANDNPNYGYAGSKTALNMFTFGLAKELSKNIKVFSVHPGSVKTDMNKQGDQTPEEQAEKIVAITKNWKEEFNGKFMRWNGEEYPL